MAEAPSPAIAGVDEFAQGHGLARQVGADRPAEKPVVMKDTDFRHVPGIIANNDGFTHIRPQGEIEVPQTLEMNAVGTHLATLGDGQEQQIELFEALREPGQKTAALAPCGASPVSLWGR